MGLTKLQPGTCCGCGCVCNVTVIGCNGVGLGGMTVSIPGVWTNTSNLSGVAGMQVPAAGTYSFTISGPGYDTLTVSRSVSCGGGFTVTLVSSSSPNVGWMIYGCPPTFSLPLPGATVTFNGQTVTSDVTGHAHASAGDPGTYPYTVTMDRYTTMTGNIVLASRCDSGGTTVNMLAASGYGCNACGFAGASVRPLPTTLSLSDSAYGSTTLTYNPSSHTWQGSLTGTFPGYCGCPSHSFKVIYDLSGSDGLCNPSPSGTIVSGCPSDAAGSSPGTTAYSAPSSSVVASPFVATITYGSSPTTCPPGQLSQALYPTGTTITITE